jgi:hypothetical protein
MMKLTINKPCIPRLRVIRESPSLIITLSDRMVFPEASVDHSHNAVPPCGPNYSSQRKTTLWGALRKDGL